MKKITSVAFVLCLLGLSAFANPVKTYQLRNVLAFDRQHHLCMMGAANLEALSTAEISISARCIDQIDYIGNTQYQHQIQGTLSVLQPKVSDKYYVMNDIVISAGDDANYTKQLCNWTASTLEMSSKPVIYISSVCNLTNGQYVVRTVISVME